MNGLRLPLVPLSVCENNMKIKSIFEGQRSLQILDSVASKLSDGGGALPRSLLKTNSYILSEKSLATLNSFATYLVNVATTEICSICVETEF